MHNSFTAYIVRGMVKGSRYNYMHEPGKLIYRIVYVLYHCSELGMTQIKNCKCKKYSHRCSKNNDSLFITVWCKNTCYQTKKNIRMVKMLKENCVHVHNTEALFP